MEEKETKFVVREIGWLSFNERVLQEACDPRNPLIERIKFLGIFSSNLDEFFRVRVATLNRVIKASKKAKALLGYNPRKILNEIQQIVLDQQNKVNAAYDDIVKGLARKEIYILDEKSLNREQKNFIKAYFENQVRPSLFPIMIDHLGRLPELKDQSIYLAVCLKKKTGTADDRHSLIEIPTNTISRFMVLPPKFGKNYVILLDDIIRVCLEDIFSLFGFDEFEAYTLKVTRDAELDIDDDLTLSFFEKITKGLKKRGHGIPVRLVYDREIPEYFFKKLIKKISFTSTDTQIPGGRYHNFKDLIKFPPLEDPDLRFLPLPPFQHKDLNPRESIISVIKKKDVLLVYPYHTFNHLNDFLREASIDSKVTSIKMSIYRLARNSNVANALINAARNGKEVTVVLELQARFDEQANLDWADRMREEGIKVMHGIPDLKVHSKLILVDRKEKGQHVKYANISTGNFNEETALIYSDHCLFTKDPRITEEAEKVFEFFEKTYKSFTYNHLLVSPFNMRKSLISLIRNEIENAKKGKKAYILLKINHLSDRSMIDHLYDADRAGVKIDIIIRGVCSLVPGIPGTSGTINAISIIDRFLEHSRIYVFGNDGNELIYLSSADWMARNLDQRVEVACPVYDDRLKAEIREFLNFQLKDNTKARIVNGQLVNDYKREPGKASYRAQLDYYRFLKKQSGKKS